MAQGDTYQILYNGVMLAMDPQEAAEGFAALFRLAPEKAAAILARPPGTVLRSGLDARTADTYRIKLQAAGILVDVRRLPAMPSPSPVTRVSGPLAQRAAASVASGTPAMGAWTLEPTEPRAAHDPRTEVAAGFALADDARLGNSLPFEFGGTGPEYFRIWIVNVFLSIVTLGIYSAWAKVRTLQYLYGNTSLAGASFQYLAKPEQILKGRMIGLGLLGLYAVSQKISVAAGAVALVILMALSPALLVLGMSARLRFSAWRNVRFDFQRRFVQAYGISLLPLLVIGGIVLLGQAAPQGQAPGSGTMASGTALLLGLGMLVMSLGFPYWIFLFTRFMVDNAAYGNQSFRFGAQASDYFKLYYLLVPCVALLSFGGALVLGWLVTVLTGTDVQAFFQQMAQQGKDSAGQASDTVQLFTMALTAFVMLAYLPLFAFIQARQFNLRYDHLMIGKSILTCEVRTLPLLGLWLSNTVLIVLTLGLFIPWAKLRMVNYRLSCLALHPGSDLRDIVNTQHRDNAIGQEIGDLFDIDIAF